VGKKCEAAAMPKAMEIGISSIDEQHQILADMINMAESKLTENSTRGEVEDVIRDLMSYALYHFETEEELMLINDYPPIEKEKHFQEHRYFSAAIAQFLQDLRRGKLISRNELLGFVKDWLNTHILNTDKKLGDFLVSSEKSSL